MLSRVVRQFSKKESHGKAVTEITKLAHVKLDLAKIMQPNMIPLIRQNIINRKATSYASVDLVSNLYDKYKVLLHEVEQLRMKRNQHAALTKQIVLLENDAEREKQLKRHK